MHIRDKNILPGLPAAHLWIVRGTCALMFLLVCDLCQGQEGSSDIEDLLFTINEIDDFETQQAIADSAMKLANASKDLLNKHLIDITSMRGYSYLSHGMRVEALDQYFLSLRAKEFSSLSDYPITVSLFGSYGNIGNVLLDASLFEESIPYYDSAIVQGEKLLLMDEDPAYYQEDFEQLIDLKIYRAQAIRSIGKPDLAISQLKELLSVCESLESQYSCFQVLNNVGRMELLDFGNTQESRSYHMQSLKIKGLGPEYRATELHNIANTYFEEGNFEQSLVYIDSTIQLKGNLLDSAVKISSLFYSYLDRGEVYYKLSLYEKAIAEWQTALALDYDFKNLPKLFKIYGFLRDTYTLLEDSSLAKAYDDLLKTYESNYQKSSEVIRVTEESEAIRDLLNSIQVRNQKQSWLNDYLQIAVLAMLFLAVLSFYLFRNYRNKKRNALFNKLESILMKDNDS